MEQKYDEGKNAGFLEGQGKEKLLLATRMLETGNDKDFVVKIMGLKPENVVYLKEKL